MSPRRFLGLPLLVAAFLLAACGKKTSEVLGQVRPQYEPLRGRLRQIAAELPPPAGPVRETKSGRPEPKPVLREDGKGNLVFLPASQLADVKAAVDKRKGVDLLLGGDLVSLLGWTAQPSTLAGSVLESRAGKDFAADLEAIRARVRYLGVYRMIEYDPPIAQDDKNFRGGRTTVEFFVHDLDDGKRLAQWMLTAQPNEVVQYSYRKGEDPKAALESWAHSSIWTNLRQALAESLPERIGGEYQARR